MGDVNKTVSVGSEGLERLQAVFRVFRKNTTGWNFAKVKPSKLSFNNDPRSKLRRPNYQDYLAISR